MFLCCCLLLLLLPCALLTKRKNGLLESPHPFNLNSPISSCKLCFLLASFPSLTLLASTSQGLPGACNFPGPSSSIISHNIHARKWTPQLNELAACPLANRGEAFVLVPLCMPQGCNFFKLSFYWGRHFHSLDQTMFTAIQPRAVFFFQMGI